MLDTYERLVICPPQRVTAKAIIREVAEKYNLTVEQLTGPLRWRSIAWPRHEAMYRIRSETALSYPDIGRRMGDRDHTTIMHGVKAHAKRTGAPVPR